MASPKWVSSLSGLRLYTFGLQFIYTLSLSLCNKVQFMAWTTISSRLGLGKTSEKSVFLLDIVRCWQCFWWFLTVLDRFCWFFTVFPVFDRFSQFLTVFGGFWPFWWFWPFMVVFDRVWWFLTVFGDFFLCFWWFLTVIDRYFYCNLTVTLALFWL